MLNNLSTPIDDKKPFKGKGAEQWLATAIRQYERIVREMRQLSEDSKVSGGRNYFVYLHYNKATGRYFLQWRSYGKGYHLTWDRIVGAVNRLGEVHKQYYYDTNEMIDLLNAQESAARNVVKRAEYLIAGKKLGGRKNNSEMMQ